MNAKSLKKLVTYTCEFCGQSFSSKKKGQRYCSYSCSAKATQAKRGHVLGGNPKKPWFKVSIPGVCEFCGKDFIITNKFRPQRFCSKACGTLARHARTGHTKEGTEKRIREFIRSKGRFCPYSEIQKELHLTDKTFSHWGINCTKLNEDEGFFSAIRMKNAHIVRQALLSGKYHSLKEALTDLGINKKDVNIGVIKSTKLLESIGIKPSTAKYPTKESLENAIIDEIRREGAQLPASELVRRLHFDYEIAVKYGIKMYELHAKAGVKYYRNHSYNELIFLKRASAVFKSVLWQHSFDDCRSPITGRKLVFDFFIEDIKALVEIDGDQHYKKDHPIHSEKLEVHDLAKTTYAQNHGLKLVRIPVSPSGSYEDRVDEVLRLLISGRCKTH